jgi:hypothetical protein
MTPDERQLLAGLFDRIRAAAGTPRDRDADALIGDAVREMPFAPYLLAQTVLVHEATLRAASERVQQLEAQVRDLEARAAAQPAAEATSFLGGIGKSIFGASAPAASPQAAAPASGPWGRVASPPPQQPQQPTGGWGQQQPQPGPWQQQAAAPAAGGGFLKGALGAAAGVAGGVLLADSIRGLMGGHAGGFGAGQMGVGGFGGGDTVINNYYENNPSAAALHDQDVRDDAISDAADGYQSASYDDGGSFGDDTTDV